MSEQLSEIRKAAMDLLARREHSQRELRVKLARKFDDERQIAQALEALEEEGLQSDRRYAEAYLRGRAARGYGPVRIRREMADRGLSDRDIQTAFNLNEINWLDNLQQVVERKYGAAPAVDFQEKSRRARFLQYRGFTPDHIREVLD